MNSQSGTSVELERLKAIEVYGLENGRSSLDDDLEHLTRLVQSLYGVTWSAISIIGAETVWFKAPQGDGNWNELALSQTICAVATESADGLVVPDLRLDPRFARAPIVEEHGFRFYAGTPLVTPSGVRIGTLCVLDRAPKELSDVQWQGLKTLADQVIRTLEHRRLALMHKRKSSFLTTLFNSIQGGLLAEDEAGNTIYVNSGFVSYLEAPFDPLELMGKPAIDSLRSLAGSVVDSTEFTILLRAQVDHESISTFDLTTRDGRFIEGEKLPIFEGDGLVGRLWVFRDVTERKRIEALLEERRNQVIHAAKMSTLGEMAAGVAHEINNPIAIISGYVKQIIEGFDLGALNIEEAVKKLSKVESSCQRIGKIVRSLKTFARDGSQDPFERSELPAIVSDTLELCRARASQVNVDIRVKIEGKSLSFDCQPVSISQVLLNLVGNAIDALESVEGERWVEIHCADLGERIAVRVSDSGPGIPEAIRAKIMNPFFTTKEVGKGTGMGLSICKGLVESHSGRLYFDEYNGHTSFVVEIPKRHTFQEFAGKRILVVDDEPDLVEIIGDLFTKQGCTVLTAMNGEQALKILLEETIDAVISDVRMPKVDGFQLLTRMKTLFKTPPPVFFVSGFADQNEDEAKLLGARALLNKPVDGSVISEEVRQAFRELAVRKVPLESLFVVTKTG